MCRQNESRGQCRADELGRSNVGTEPAESFNISATSVSANTDELCAIRQWLHKLQSVLVMDDDINQIIRYKTISIDNGNISITETIIAILNNGEVIHLDGVDEITMSALEAKGATIN